MSLEKLTKYPLTIGISSPIDNDFSRVAQKKRGKESRPFGVPNMSEHRRYITMVDKMGFNTIWLRDVPVYGPTFADAGQIYELSSYLGYIAGITENILLGSAAFVLPLREPWLLRKTAQTLQELSDNRLLLGVASGDRKSEYPLFGVEYEKRGEIFRKNLDILRGFEDKRLCDADLTILPKAPNPPLLVTGLAQQTLNYVGENFDAWVSYPGSPDAHKKRIARWKKAAGEKPYITFLGVNLLKEDTETIDRNGFDIKTGVSGLINELNELKNIGVAHVGLSLRASERHIEGVLEDIATHVLPEFHRERK